MSSEKRAEQLQVSKLQQVLDAKNVAFEAQKVEVFAFQDKFAGKGLSLNY